MENSNIKPLEVAKVVEDLLHGTVLLFLRFCFTTYRFAFLRTPFPLSEEPDPRSSARSLGPVTFAVLSWVLYLSTVHLLFRAIFAESSRTNNETKSNLFTTAVDFLWEAISSGNIFLILLSLSPVIYLICALAIFHLLGQHLIGKNKNFDACISVSSYLVGSYAVFATIICISLVPMLITNKMYWMVISVPTLLVSIWLIFRRWLELIEIELDVPKARSIKTILCILPVIITCIWLGLEFLSLVAIQK